LLTDGGVLNTDAIVELVIKNCGPKSSTTLQTLGIGQGADEHLIKRCALVGRGNYYFIYKDEEI
jgi:hypothetical protein